MCTQWGTTFGPIQEITLKHGYLKDSMKGKISTFIRGKRQDIDIVVKFLYTQRISKILCFAIVTCPNLFYKMIIHILLSCIFLLFIVRPNREHVKEILAFLADAYAKALTPPPIPVSGHSDFM